MTKREWITLFRNRADSILAEVNLMDKDQKGKASEINKQIKAYRDKQLEITKTTSVRNSWNNEQLLNEILLLTYASYVVMLEYRNKVWKYEYMAFARRIGELWEPFCKLPFEYPVKHLTIIDPPDFNDVQNRIRMNAHEYIDNLVLDSEIKEELKRHYAIPWTMVDSGGIKLALDLHFEQSGSHYNCDFKSGFIMTSTLLKMEVIIIVILKADLVQMRKEIQIDYYLLPAFIIHLVKSKRHYCLFGKVRTKTIIICKH